jgi:hypothetical protein
MKEYLLLDSKTRNLIKALAYYQIGGGIIGIGTVLWLMLSTGTITGGILFILILASCLYYFSIYCGRILLTDALKGLNVSLYNQALQTIYFALGGYAYKYAAGIFCMIGFDLIGDSNFLFHLTLSQFQFNFNLETGKIAIGFNIVAFVLFYYVGKLKYKLEELNQISTKTDKPVITNEELMKI